MNKIIISFLKTATKNISGIEAERKVNETILNILIDFCNKNKAFEIAESVEFKKMDVLGRYDIKNNKIYINDRISFCNDILYNMDNFDDDIITVLHEHRHCAQIKRNIFIEEDKKYMKDKKWCKETYENRPLEKDANDQAIKYKDQAIEFVSQNIENELLKIEIKTTEVKSTKIIL